MNILESDEEIERMMMAELVVQLNAAFQKIVPKIRKIVGDLLRTSIMAQSEYAAIINSDLRYELGIIDPSARLIRILDELVRNIEVNFTPFAPAGDKFSGGITINAVKSDYSDIIHLRDAIVTTEKGVELEWLRWLLLEGRSVIIAGYDVEFGPFGRTGGAHMIETGGNWRVPSEYAGRENNNFIIRAIKQAEPLMKEQIEACIASI